MPNSTKSNSKPIKKQDETVVPKPTKSANKYEEVFKVEGTFEEIIKKLVTPKK